MFKRKAAPLYLGPRTSPKANQEFLGAVFRLVHGKWASTVQSLTDTSRSSSHSALLPRDTCRATFAQKARLRFFVCLFEQWRCLKANECFVFFYAFFLSGQLSRVSLWTPHLTRAATSHSCQAAAARRCRKHCSKVGWGVTHKVNPVVMKLLQLEHPLHTHLQQPSRSQSVRVRAFSHWCIFEAQIS